jgi:hypothetical protein
MSGPPKPVPALMGGDPYERLSGNGPPHRCRLPGWWRRWRDGVKPGAIWRCSCGLRYEYRPWEVVYVHLIRPGQDTAPWWPLIEMGPPPKPVRTR